MEKKYQVFVSSTYSDLQEERKEVIQRLLELDCIPVGMELFPAADEDQWIFIKGVIDECDYYVVIVAGRYGSCHADGMSYTEMEYRYALKTGKPIVAFLHGNPGSISADNTEQDPEKRERLEAFRELAKNKLCKMWSNCADLGGVVATSVVNLKKSSPATGWVRADRVPDKNAFEKIHKLRERIDELEGQLRLTAHMPPPGTEELAQGDDEFAIHYTRWLARAATKGVLKLKWGSIISLLLPHMAGEASESTLHSALLSHARRTSKVPESHGFQILGADFQTVKVQLKALGLIELGVRARSSADHNTYWKLTPYGDHYMTKVAAIRRDGGSPVAHP